GFHELGHAWIASKYYDVETNSVTVWAFGGVYDLERPKPHERFWISAGGLGATFVFNGLLIALLQLVNPTNFSLIFVVGWFALGNLGILIFNLLPIYPNDGGTMLRSRLSGSGNTTDSAFDVAINTALVLIILGVLINSVVLVFITVFIFVATYSELRK
ncbi:MAG: peptidase M50, partial [Halobacteria archaeon]|nr:peptidase M50 [Halobacteria archaeon]